MWIMTRYGFISVTCARKGKGEHWQPIDPDRLMVRARSKAHLESLQARFQALQGTEVFESPSADYRYRLFVRKDFWALVVSELALETDYDNFKNEVACSLPQDREYLSALHRTWSTMLQLQK